MNPAPLSVDVWLDVACPFCALGDRRLENVIANLPFGENVEPGSQAEKLIARGMDPHQLEASHRHLSEQGDIEGFTFNFETSMPSNTFTAHRFLQAAAAENIQQPVLDALFRAYFTDGVDVGDTARLRDIVVGAGLSESAADEVVANDDAFRVDVERDIAQAAQYGIQGVPFFVLAGKYGISGAQPAEAFEQALTQVYGELQEQA